MSSSGAAVMYHEAPTPRTLVPKRFTDAFEKGTDARIRAFRESLARWVNAHADPKDRRVANELAKIIKYVPFVEFLDKFKGALRTVSQDMRGPYYMVTHVARLGERTEALDLHTSRRNGPAVEMDVPKSSAWLAPYVKETLGTRHAVQGYVWVNAARREVSVSDSATNDSAGGRELRRNRWVPSGDRNVVYVDDGSYSGEQIMNFYLMFCAKMWNDFRSARTVRNGQERTGMTHLWYVVPYLSEQAEYRLNGMSMNHLALESILETQADHLEEYGAKISDEKEAGEFLGFIRSHLQVHFDQRGYERMPLTEDVFGRLGIRADYVKRVGVLGAGLFLFEHKAPDAVSFPKPLAMGQLLVRRALKDPRDTPGLARVPFMSQVDEKPYGHTQPGMMVHLIGSRDNAAIRYSDASLDRHVQPQKPMALAVAGPNNKNTMSSKKFKMGGGVSRMIKSLMAKKKASTETQGKHVTNKFGLMFY